MTDWEKTWVMDISWDEATQQIVRAGATNEFQLQAVTQRGTLKAYRVTFCRGSMAPLWADSILFETGQSPAQKLPAPVPESTIAGMANADPQILEGFQSDIDKAIQEGGSAISRLEGDVEIDGVPFAAKFYRIPDSVVPTASAGSKNKDILIVKLEDLTGGGRPDGTGAGHPKS